MKIKREEEFRLWLTHVQGISGRSVSDACSLLRRAARMLDTEPENLIVQDASRLEALDVFHKCSVTVRSQLRRAVTRYAQFSRS